MSREHSGHAVKQRITEPSGQWPKLQITLPAGQWRRIVAACERREDWLSRFGQHITELVSDAARSSTRTVKLKPETLRYLLAVCQSMRGILADSTLSEIAGGQMETGQEGLSLPVTEWLVIVATCEQRQAWLADLADSIRPKVIDKPPLKPVALTYTTPTWVFVLDTCLIEQERASASISAQMASAEFFRPERQPDPEEEAALKEQIEIARAIVEEYGEDPVPRPELPKKPTKQTKHMNSDQRSLFMEEGVTASV